MNFRQQCLETRFIACGSSLLSMPSENWGSAARLCKSIVNALASEACASARVSSEWRGRHSGYPARHSLVRVKRLSFSNSRHALARKRLFEIGEAVGENSIDRRVFGQLVRINLVECVGRGVVIV